MRGKNGGVHHLFRPKGHPPLASFGVNPRQSTILTRITLGDNRERPPFRHDNWGRPPFSPRQTKEGGLPAAPQPNFRRLSHPVQQHLRTPTRVPTPSPAFTAAPRPVPPAARPVDQSLASVPRSNQIPRFALSPAIPYSRISLLRLPALPSLKTRQPACRAHHLSPPRLHRQRRHQRLHLLRLNTQRPIQILQYPRDNQKRRRLQHGPVLVIKVRFANNITDPRFILQTNKKETFCRPRSLFNNYRPRHCHPSISRNMCQIRRPRHRPVPQPFPVHRHWMPPNRYRRPQIIRH